MAVQVFDFFEYFVMIIVYSGVHIVLTGVGKNTRPENMILRGKQPFFSYHQVNALVLFFTQFGRFIFSCVILEDYKNINLGNLFLTVIPLLICLVINFVSLKIIVNVLCRSGISLDKYFVKNGQDIEKGNNNELLTDEQENFNPKTITMENKMNEDKEDLPSILALIFDYKIHISSDYNKLLIKAIRRLYMKKNRRKKKSNFLYSDR